MDAHLERSLSKVPGLLDPAAAPCDVLSVSVALQRVIDEEPSMLFRHHSSPAELATLQEWAKADARTSAVAAQAWLVFFFVVLDASKSLAVSHAAKSGQMCAPLVIAAKNALSIGFGLALALGRDGSFGLRQCLDLRLHSTFGEFVEGLDRADASSFPLTLKDLKLKEKRIQEELDEDGGFPFDLTNGRIGNITVSPGWMGTVEVVATNVVLNFSFSAMKAMNKAMRKDSEDEEEFEGVPSQAPMPHPGVPLPADVPPRFCQNHFTSAQREKIDPLMRPCQKCNAQITSTYAEMTLCPPCSNTEESCMICGDHAPVASNYVPPKTLGNPKAQQQQQQQQQGMVYALPETRERLGSSLPPPPPGAGGYGGPSSMSPSRRSQNFDWEWPSPGQPPSPPRPPSPPPPPPSNRAMASRGKAQAPQSVPPSAPGSFGHGHGGHGGHGGPAPGPAQRPGAMRAGATYSTPTKENRRPADGPRSPANLLGPGTGKEEDTWEVMKTSANNRWGELMDYFGTWPTLDMNQWASCLNGDHSDDMKEVGLSPRPSNPNARMRPAR
ncbi:unnamed protein product [Effrenium voratum]|nr:unnamed protein product [Effrenium voratum]